MTDPNSSDTQIRENGDKARGGETSGHMRYVLAISILLAIGILSAIVWVPLLFNK